MARINTDRNISTWSIRKFLGLNEDPDGGVMKPGEFSVLKNFRITRENHLQPRPGTKVAVNLFDKAGTPDAAFEETYAQGFWHGFVGGRELTLAACGGFIYETDPGNGTAKVVGHLMDGTSAVSFFSFGSKVYVLGDGSYQGWDGSEEGSFSNVDGYIPLVLKDVKPDGTSGIQVENVNRLTGWRAAAYITEEAVSQVTLPVSGGVKALEVEWNGKKLAEGEWDDEAPSPNDGDYTHDDHYADGYIRINLRLGFKRTDTLTVRWLKESSGEEVRKMRFAEFYNGAADSRVFLYGDGSNRTIYSGIRYDNGQPSAEYFPDLYEAAIGDDAPVTAMTRYYGKLLAFKTNSTWSIQADTMQLADGAAVPAFYVTPVNRQYGNDAPGQVQILENEPVSVDAGSIYRWKNATIAGLSSSDSSVRRISGPVSLTLKTFSANRIRTFNVRYHQEYWFLHDGKALVLNYGNDCWYFYDGLPFSDLLEVGTEYYGLCDDGNIVHISGDYSSSGTVPIDREAVTGAMDFDRPWLYKCSPLVFASIEPKSGAVITIGAETDSGAETESISVTGKAGQMPQVERLKLRCKGAASYRLTFKSHSAAATATVLGCDIAVRLGGKVK